MGNILKSELFKLGKNKAVRIVSIITICSAVFMTFVFALLSAALKHEGAPALLTAESAFLMSMSSDGQTLLIMLAAVVTSVVVTDHTRGILRNMMVSGHSRLEVYIGKFLASSIVGMALCFISTFIYFLGGLFFGGIGVSPIRFLLQYLLLFIMFIAFVGIATLIAFLTKSTGATIGISIALIFVFSIVSIVALVLQALEVNDFWQKAITFISEIYVGNLLTGVADFSTKTSKLIQYFITALATIMLTNGLGILAFNKMDIK